MITFSKQASILFLIVVFVVIGSYEITNNLFLQCPFIMQHWNWFSSLLGMPLDLSTSNSLLNTCNKGLSPQLHDLIIATSFYVEICVGIYAIEFAHFKS
jgi:hypothetical protein